MSFAVLVNAIRANSKRCKPLTTAEIVARARKAADDDELRDRDDDDRDEDEDEDEDEDKDDDETDDDRRKVLAAKIILSGKIVRGEIRDDFILEADWDGEADFRCR